MTIFGCHQLLWLWSYTCLVFVIQVDFSRMLGDRTSFKYRLTLSAEQKRTYYLLVELSSLYSGGEFIVKAFAVSRLKKPLPVLYRPLIFDYKLEDLT